MRIPVTEVSSPKFIATYGSHYTTKLVLGAKRILTTTMSSQTVAELTRESVDIASTLSVKMQVSLLCIGVWKPLFFIAEKVSKSF